jgi:hypothetical protein
MNDFYKSIKAILYDRITSPLYGTIIVSWLLWNWKIPYVTFFVSEENLPNTKIDYILSTNKNIGPLIFYPLISALIIITIIPLISNGAYWITLQYDQWRIDKKNIAERKQILTLEQSIELHKEVENVNNSLAKTILTKDTEIKGLKMQISEASNQIDVKKTEINEINKTVKKLETDKTTKNKEIEKLNKDLIDSKQSLAEFQKLAISNLENARKDLKELIIFDPKTNLDYPAKISDFFSKGRWVNTYKDKNGQYIYEPFEIINDDYYLRSEGGKELRFKIVDVLYNADFNILKFTKIDVRDSNRRLENIVIQKGLTFSGIENPGKVDITYDIDIT